MTLLEECLNALGNDICILTGDEKLAMENKFYDIVPLTTWGRIDWGKFKKIKEVKKLEDLNLIDGDRKYYIIWGDTEKPIIKSRLANILNNLDDVLAVSFDTWILDTDESMVLEFYHELDITIGMLADLM